MSSSDTPQMSETGAILLEKIQSKAARVGIVGLGYVGLPLVQAVHDAGYRVIGFDVDDTKIQKLNRGESYLKHLGDVLTQTLAASDRFVATSDEMELAHADIVILCVPTPITKQREPDLRYVLGSGQSIGRVLREGQLVVLESTTYPGTTRDLLVPVLQQGAIERGLDLELGEHFFVGYSPEREDPGRAGTVTSMIPKIVGGVDAVSGFLAIEFYRSCIEHVHPVSSAEVGEASKLLENVYRAVNIALVNELKTVFERMGIDIWEVIEAAKTKPFGFHAFYPGPGLGGHCIPIDPYYLSWKAKQVGHETRFIELAGEINRVMPRLVVNHALDGLREEGKELRGAMVMVVGVAYKPDVDDIRESPAAEIIAQLLKRGARVKYHDPHIPSFPSMRHYDIKLDSVELSAEQIKSADCVIIVTDHKQIDWDMLGRHASLIIDSRNAMDRYRTEHPQKNTSDWIARVIKA